MCVCVRFCSSIAAYVVVYVWFYVGTLPPRRLMRLLATLAHPYWGFTLARLQFYYCEHLVNLLLPFILSFVKFIFILYLHFFMSTAACNHAYNRLLQTLLCHVTHCSASCRSHTTVWTGCRPHQQIATLRFTKKLTLSYPNLYTRMYAGVVAFFERTCL